MELFGCSRMRLLTQGLPSQFGVRSVRGRKMAENFVPIMFCYNYAFPNHFLNNYLQAIKKMRVGLCTFWFGGLGIGGLWHGSLVTVTAGPGLGGSSEEAVIILVTSLGLLPCVGRFA